MVKIKGFKDLFNKIRLIWISLIFKIKNFFSDNTDKSSNTSSNKQNENGDEIDSEGEQEVWYDALEELTEQELDEDEYFDTVEHLNEQEANVNNKGKECEENKYYSLQDGLQEKTEFDRATHTLALAFEINEPRPGNFNTDLSKFKLCELKQNGNKYTFTLEDDQKNRREFHSEYLNMYFPQYFNKCSEKRTYTGLFSPKENRVSNDIILPLQVPKEVSILTKEFGWMNPRKVIQSTIPNSPMDVYLRDCKDHVNFYLNSNNTISLSLTSMEAKSAAILSGTPTETKWPIKDVLIRDGFANIVNEHTYEQPVYKQPGVEKVDSEFEYIKVEPDKRMPQGISK